MSQDEFAVTMLGGLLLAWIVYRCDSLWPAVGVHSALNLSWQLTHNSSDVTPVRRDDDAAGVDYDCDLRDVAGDATEARSTQNLEARTWNF